VAAAVIAGGGVALAQADGSSKSKRPATTTGKQQTTPRGSNATPRAHDCPNSGSNPNSNAGFDL